MKTFWVAALIVIALSSDVSYGNSVPVKTANRFGQLPVYFVENRGELDAFISKIAPNATFIYSGYVCGSDGDVEFAVAVDARRKVYIAGYTYSNQTTFPVIDGPDVTFNGSSDAFIARLNISGVTFDYCGYIGGSDDDFPGDVAVDPQNNAYVAGYTESTQTTFPVLIEPDLTYNGGNIDAFITKISPP